MGYWRRKWLMPPSWKARVYYWPPCKQTSDHCWSTMYSRCAIILLLVYRLHARPFFTSHQAKKGSSLIDYIAIASQPPTLIRVIKASDSAPVLRTYVRTYMLASLTDHTWLGYSKRRSWHGKWEHVVRHGQRQGHVTCVDMEICCRHVGISLSTLDVEFCSTWLTMCPGGKSSIAYMLL